MIGRLIKTVVVAWISQKAIEWVTGSGNDKRRPAPVRANRPRDTRSS